MRKRPMLAIGLALAALVVVTLLLSLFADPTPPKRVVPPANYVDKKGPPNPAPPPPKPTPVPSIRPAVAVDRTDLEHIFDDVAAKEIKAKIDGKINLESGLVFKAGKDQHLELGTDDNKYNGVTFHFTRSNATNGLLIEGGEEVVFKKVRFQLDAEDVWPKLDTVAAAVTLRGVKTVRFEQCVFVQPRVPPLGFNRGPLASVFIDTPPNADSPRPVVNLNDCLFDSLPHIGGQVALAINGAATVNLTNCAFMPHAALVQFDKECKTKNTSVRLHHCDGFVVNGPTFRFNTKASAQIYASDNVFSRPMGSALPTAQSPQMVPPQAGLIFLPEDASVEYVGDNNVYHNLNDFVERSSKEGVAEEKKGMVLMEGRHDFLAKHKGKDERSTVLEAAASPHHRTSVLDRFAEETAFQLKPEYQARGVGLRTWLGQDWTGPVRLVDVPPPAGKSRERIVDADDGGKTPGVYAKLGGALADAEDGDIILIKHGDDAEIVMPPVSLKPGISVTLRAFKGCEPILVLDKAYRDKDSFLFKVVKDGKLQIENMEIILDPVSSGFDAQSIVHLGESGHCVFKNCYLTLRATNNVPLNVATFVDLAGMMKPEGANSAAARVEFHECFVRGKGDLVNLNGCRMLHVDVKNSLVALDGSLLDIRAANKVMPMNQGVRWKMERSSVFTTESVFTLHSKAGKGLTETLADIEGCLLVSLAPRQPVVELGLPDEPIEKYLKWDGRQNFYANFDKDSIRDWKEQYKEMNSHYKGFTFADFKDEKLQKLWDATPDWFRPIDAEVMGLSEFGLPAAIEKRMMPPSSKSDVP